MIDMFLTAPISELDTYINEHTSNPHYDSAIRVVFDNDEKQGSIGAGEDDQKIRTSKSLTGMALV